MKIEEQALSAINLWESSCLTEKAKRVLDFAKKQRNLASGVITIPDGNKCAAAEYGFQLYCNAAEIAADDSINQETYQIIALLMTMEAIRTDSWSYGAKLLYDLRNSGIKLTREEISAFLAQEGTFATNPRKASLMDANTAAIAICCANMATLYGSLRGRCVLFQSAPDSSLMAQVESCWSKPGAEGSAPVACSNMEIIEKLLNTYALAYLGAEQEANLIGFIKFLRSSGNKSKSESEGFYSAPTKETGPGAYTGGLAEHTVSMFCWLISLVKPQDAGQVGELVMAAVGHGLCHVNAFVRNTWEQEKVYCDDGNLQEPDGRKFKLQSKETFIRKDKMPFGYGRKSLYILTSYFGASIKENLAAAIDGYLHDPSENSNIAYQMMEYPLCVYLAMAEIAVSHHDEIIGR